MTRRPIDFTGFLIAGAILLVWAFGVSGCAGPARDEPFRDDISWRILRDHHQHHERQDGWRERR